MTADNQWIARESGLRGLSNGTQSSRPREFQRSASEGNTMRTKMINAFACCIAALAMSCLQSAMVSAQDDQLQTKETNSEDLKASVIRIVVEPMIYHPAEWKPGRITVGVQCQADNKSRTIGIATDVELVAIRTYHNRFEMMLRSSPKIIATIRAAAELSEYWFTVTPFIEKHRQLVADEPELKDFLAKNKEFKPTNDSNWGYNSRSDKRLPPPTEQELPTRATSSTSDSGLLEP